MNILSKVEKKRNKQTFESSLTPSEVDDRNPSTFINFSVEMAKMKKILTIPETETELRDAKKVPHQN